MTATVAVHWLVALAPVLVLATLFAWLDSFKLMTRWEMAGVLLAGIVAGLAAYPVSGRFLDALPLGFSDYSRFVAPWIEEALKAGVVTGLFVFNRVGFKPDAAAQGFAIGAGFALVENVIYLGRFPDLDTATWLVRGLGTAIMHGGTAAIMTTLAHEFDERAAQRANAAAWRLNPLWFVPGYLIAVGIHIAFNQFPDQPLYAMLGAVVLVPAVLFAIFYFGTGEARALLASDQTAHRVALDAFAAGGWPDDDSGRRLARLTDTYRDGTLAEPIRRYVEVLVRLTLEAETALLAQSATDARVTSTARADFTELSALRRELGRRVLRALRPLLPLSRNDWWEIGELRERLKKAS